MAFTDGLVTVTDPSSFSGNPFEYSISLVNSLADPNSGWVPQQLKLHRDKADEAYDQAISTIDALKGITFEVPSLDIIPTIDPSIPFDPSRPVFARTTFGDVDNINIPDAPSTGGLPSITSPNIPTFTPSIGSINIPQPPVMTQYATPGDPPASPTLTFPTLDPISYPDEPQLADINIPVFDGIDLPAVFNPEYPDIDDPVINTLIDWQEPTYTKEIIDSVIAKIQQMLDGGLAIDPTVEQGIVDRGRDREDRLVRQAVSQATDEIAGRGYTAPPGVLVERIDNIREEGLLKKLGLNRDVVIKIFDEELANMRLAVQQGIAAEQLFVQMFLASVERLFEVQRLNLSSQIELYNLQVNVFNARMREVEIRASVYETQIRAALAEVEVFKALVDAERAKAEINNSLVDMYTAQIEARKVFVEVYEAQVRAVGIQADVYATQIQAFRGIVEAYAAQIGAEKVKFEAYDSQVRGEIGKASIIESEARAYAAEIEGISAGVRADVEVLRGEVSKIEADISAYLANVQGKTANADIQLRSIQADIQGFAADTQKYIADGGIIESENRVITAAWEAANRTNLAYFDAQVAKYRTVVESLTQQARVALGALTASGDISSTISAGALAAMHLGASINAGGQVGASGTQTQGFSESVGQSASKSCVTQNSSSGNWTSDAPINVECPI